MDRATVALLRWRHHSRGSSDTARSTGRQRRNTQTLADMQHITLQMIGLAQAGNADPMLIGDAGQGVAATDQVLAGMLLLRRQPGAWQLPCGEIVEHTGKDGRRSEDHTSELQSLMRI